MLVRKIGFAFALLALAVDFASPHDARAEKPIYAVYGNYGEETIASIRWLVLNTQVNAVVLDIKSDEGRTLLSPYHKSVIKEFREMGAYVVCRIVVFKHSYFKDKKGNIILDPAYAAKREPTEEEEKKRGIKELQLWQDNSGNNWLDPGAEGVWRYAVLTAKEGIRAGCSEINLDYIRFPSPIDGSVRNAIFQHTKLSRWEDNSRKREMIKKFAAYFSDHIKEVPVSADVFGYAFAKGSEPGIGQHMEDFARAGFILAPMAYPTHYSCNDKSFTVADPSLVPYEVYDMTLNGGIKHLHRLGLYPKIRPWLQAFSIRNICYYTKKGCPKGCGEIEVQYRGNRFREQDRALKAHGIFGWFAWHPKGEYPKDLFLPKQD